MKKIISILTLIMMFSFMNVYADHTIDFSKKSNLTITLEESENKEKVVGAELKVTKIADAKVDGNSNLAYEFIDELKDSNISLKDVTVDGLLDEINNYINDNEIALNGQSEITNDEGVAKFSNLDLGLYIVSQENIVEGYSSIDSYLLTIPTIIDNDWVYDLDSLPKTELIKLIDINIEKIWKNNRISVPKSVTIDLLKDGELVEEVILSADNNWKHTFRRLPLSDSYSVKEVEVPKGYKVTYKQDGYNFTIINTNKLPQTGEYTYIIPIFIAIGIIFIGLGIFFERRGKVNE